MQLPSVTASNDPPGLSYLLQEAVALQRRGQLDEAARRYEAVLLKSPGHFDALHQLGVLRARQGRLAEGERLLRRAVQRQPRSVAALNNHGNTLNLMKRHEAAVEPLEKATAIDPRDPVACNNLGIALEALGREGEAVACFERALALKPDYLEAVNNLAITHWQRGRLEEARRRFETAIRLEPENPAYYLRAFQCYRVSSEDPHVAALEDLARRSAALAEEGRAQLHFALAKAYADLGRQALAFDHLLQANALKRRHVLYDEGRQLARIERIRRVFTRELMREKAGLGATADAPIFILGMMRSGSTLIEQILASHPAVAAAGEVSCFNQAYAAMHRRFQLSAPFPDAVPLLAGEHLRRLGEEYLRLLETQARGSRAGRITDKMPGNFTAVGIIHLALPRARIIHTVRDPVDTCLSCFATSFGDDQPFTYDLRELGRYYRAYAELMEHWRQVLPAGAMLEVRYEDVVSDFETQARRILQYCGLEWHEACRSFHRTERPVRTASATQVRQPLYRSSMGRPRPDPKVLAPLLEGLGTRVDIANAREA